MEPQEDRDHGSTHPGRTGMPDDNYGTTQQASGNYPHRPQPGTRPEEASPDAPIRNNDVYGNAGS
jgi:hypothetical protein